MMLLCPHELAERAVGMKLGQPGFTAVLEQDAAVLTIVEVAERIAMLVEKPTEAITATGERFEDPDRHGWPLDRMAPQPLEQLDVLKVRDDCERTTHDERSQCCIEHGPPRR